MKLFAEQTLATPSQIVKIPILEFSLLNQNPVSYHDQVFHLIEVVRLTNPSYAFPNPNRQTRFAESALTTPSRIALLNRLRRDSSVCRRSIKIFIQSRSLVKKSMLRKIAEHRPSKPRKLLLLDQLVKMSSSTTS
ncbi:uncharacterized protein LOC123889692 isoform X3 [Trifolium pratense]|uniref:Uncharacterized protein n=1 Tax=Trifolium pratense TaxID=57577 RepID=A0ACB0JQ23_TRIPR|nr:uncharacterized protein LOC123889692 isoform X3 [Trifolium pratense]XP_045795107.1 uncharacterized protein LOC123889692 isoform X3 [Trifolium pratense]CAJ2645512.1 unnamed protein product [Trifolium pratense]